jgi:hypothetical protein
MHTIGANLRDKSQRKKMRFRISAYPEPGILNLIHILPAWPSLRPFRTYAIAFSAGFDYACDIILNMVEDPILGYSASTVDDISASMTDYRVNAKDYDLNDKTFQHPCYKGFHRGAVAAVRYFNLPLCTQEVRDDVEEIPKCLEAGVHHEFVRLVEIDDQGEKAKKGSGKAQQNLAALGRHMLYMMRLTR